MQATDIREGQPVKRRISGKRERYESGVVVRTYKAPITGEETVLVRWQSGNREPMLPAHLIAEQVLEVPQVKQEVSA